MTLFETIKATISMKQAAQHYGLKPNRSSMICCPFHDDRHPSLKLNEAYFFCFGCGAQGDVIDFTSSFFHLSSYEAAKKLATDFCIRSDQRPIFSISSQPKHPHIRQFREDEMLCFHALTDYLHLLEEWKLRYAPAAPDEAFDDRFVEACQMLPHVEQMADILTVGDLETRVALVDELMKANKMIFQRDKTAQRKREVKRSGNETEKF